MCFASFDVFCRRFLHDLLFNDAWIFDIVLVDTFFLSWVIPRFHFNPDFPFQIRQERRIFWKIWAEDQPLLGNPRIAGSSFLLTGSVVIILAFTGLGVAIAEYECPVNYCVNPYIPNLSFNWIQIYCGMIFVAFGAVLLLRSRSEYRTRKETLIPESY